jgi:ribonuclease III|tara:strand:- start:575 stop:1228 length:654 start_codon:yes stop_codon:yes gene_type:complete
MGNSVIKVNQSYLELPYFKQALVHKSVSQTKNNERLEFLGDAVIEIIISEYLFNSFLEMDEGRLTQVRASLVNTKTLSEMFLQFDCSDDLQLSKGTTKLDETHKYSIYAGTLEACVGAVFISLGWDESKEFILAIFKSRLELINTSDDFKDAKSRLQEKLQALNIDLPTYKVTPNKEGNQFECNVEFQQKFYKASSSIKKDSEQQVAELILEHICKA